MASYDLNDLEMRSLDSPEDNLEGALLHPAASLSDKATSSHLSLHVTRRFPTPTERLSTLPDSIIDPALRGNDDDYEDIDDIFSEMGLI